MGYYTSFSLSFLNGSAEEHDNFIAELEKVSGVDFACWGCYDKWYDWHEDMEETSKKFPNLKIVLDGDGEETWDLWEARFHNGDIEYHEAIIPEFTQIVADKTDKA